MPRQSLTLSFTPQSFHIFMNQSFILIAKDGLRGEFACANSGPEETSVAVSHGGTNLCFKTLPLLCPKGFCLLASGNNDSNSTGK